MIEKLPLHEIREICSLCEKLRRVGEGGKPIGPDSIRTIVTPTRNEARSG